MTHMSYVKDIKSRRHQHLSDAETAERSQKICGLRIHGFKVRPEDPSHVGLLRDRDMGPTKSKVAVEQSRT